MEVVEGGLLVQVHQTDRFFGQFYTRRSRHRVDRFFGRFYSRQNRRTPLPTTRPRLHNHRPRTSFAQFSADIRRLNCIADEISYPTTRRRAVRSRRTSFVSFIMPETPFRNLRVVVAQPENSMNIQRKHEQPESSIGNQRVGAQPGNSMHIQRIHDRPECSRGNQRVGDDEEISSQRERVDNLDENCLLRKWIRNMRNATQPENSMFIQRIPGQEQSLLQSQRLEIRRGENSARRKRARSKLTNEQRTVIRDIDTSRRKRARENQTIEQRSLCRDIDTSRRKRARIGQTFDQQCVRRRLDNDRRNYSNQNETAEVHHFKLALRRARRRLIVENQDPVERAVHNALRAFYRNVALRRIAHQRFSCKIVALSRRIVARHGRVPQPQSHVQSSIGDNNRCEVTIQTQIVNDCLPFTNAQVFRKSCNDIVWLSCPECKRRFPDLKISAGMCSSCKSDKRGNHQASMFSVDNSMHPGIVPLELARLTDLERILIARVHPMMSVYRVKGQQYKYGGNVINFAQDVNAIATVLPYKPADLSAILVVNRGGTHTNKEFRVRREFVREALVWLKKYHRHYGDIIIDDGTLERLPVDGIPEDIPSAGESLGDLNNGDKAVQMQTDEYEGPPELHNQDFHIDDFHAAGTIAIFPQPNQQACLLRALQVTNADQTHVHMPFTTEIINEFSTPGYIAMAFPTLFPCGNADLRQTRQRKVNPLQYFQYLMKYDDGRFAKDSRFRYFAWNSLSRWRALALGDVFVRKNPGDAELSIQDIRDMISSGDKQLVNRISYFARNIRGTRAFWFTRLKELTAMVKQLGPLTIFFTLSAADMQWPELFHILDPSNALERLSPLEKRKGRARLVNENPSVVAWFFQARVSNFFREYLSNEFSVVDHWYRFEWQNRGSGHIHGFLWLRGAPDVSGIGTSAEVRSNVIEYFDRLVSTVNPDPSMDKNIQEHPCARALPLELNLDTDENDYALLVNWVMRHSICGSHCLRLHKTTKQMGCRFRYPFDVLDKSKIVEEPPNSNMFRFIGRRNDELVCSHNRKILQTWRANIDWSPVLSVQSVVNYIAKYASKSEPASKSFTETLREIVEDLRRPCQNAKSAFKRLLMKSVSERDISAQEVCHLLMGYLLVRSSRKFVLLNVSEKSMLTSTLCRRRGDEDEEIVGTDPSFVGKYMQRPPCYENTSLLDMAKRHYFNRKGWHTSRVSAIVRLVPQLDGDILPNTEKWESFCRQQVLIHHHFRSLEEAKGDFILWSERYIDLGFGEHQSVILPEPIDEEFEDDIEIENDMEDLFRDEWMMAAAMGPLFVPGENVELGRRDFDTSYNWAEGLYRYPNMESERKFVHTLRSGEEVNVEPLIVTLDELSHEQRVAHDMVIRALECRACIRMIVCGGAGTGKSTLINAIVHSINEFFRSAKAVRVMAPTGVAAFNVGGATIHHELAIRTEQRTERNVSKKFKSFEGDQCQRMQEDFKDTKLIIIDEYSMVGTSMLANIDRRCRDIFGPNEPFGNVSILLVGDMRQLPPVCDRALYKGGGSPQQLYGGLMYSFFDKCVRLSHIFRQAGDRQALFREALMRLSDGTSTIDDWKLFLTRDFSLLSAEEINTFKYALRLFPTKQAAHDYNLNRLIELGKPVARILSKNNCDTASRALSDDAKGLEKVLCLSVGARVMLRSNLATHNGLVNGAMGIIVDIVYANGCKSPEDIPLAVMVDFDNYCGPKFRPDSNIIPIAPQTTHWKTNDTSCQRTQIPLVLCWAITIHKSQGLTLNQAVVDIGERESLGLTFVALSRTRKLCDLAFSPMFTLDRLQRIGRCAGLKGRLQEESRLLHMSTTSIS